jgi:hypothetical protein
MHPPFDQSAANGGSRNIAKNIQQPLLFGPGWIVQQTVGFALGKCLSETDSYSKS